MKNKSNRFCSIAGAVIIAVFMTACTQTQTSNPNVEIVQGIYEAFAAGDGGAVLANSHLILSGMKPKAIHSRMAIRM
jgi:hypothetical protein